MFIDYTIDQTAKEKNYQEYLEARKHAHKNAYPKHVAIIMDGNGRWAKSRGRPRQWGHIKGSQNVREIIRKAGKMGIEVLTLYCFSTENWKRNEIEVRTLMKLFKKHLLDSKDFQENNARVFGVGEISRLPQDVSKVLYDLETQTQHNQGIRVNLCVSYGSRQEILEGIKNVAQEYKENKINLSDINEDYFSKHLYTQHVMDPDYIIRTSGELRLSNFLLWQCAYAELYVTEKLWPDFHGEDFEIAVNEYLRRQRRFGGA